MKGAASLVVLSSCGSGALAAGVSSKIQVVGRHSATDAGIAFDMPGVTIRARFTGSDTIAAKMSKLRAGGDTEDHFVVSCDGVSTVPGSGIAGASFTTDKWASDEEVRVVLCSGLDPTAEHDVEVFKATEAQWNALVVKPNYVTFSGFTGSGLQLLDAPALPARKLEFLGDSITAGFCNLCDDALQPSGGMDKESFALSWPTLVGKTLGAQVHAAAWSGYGMAENCCGGQTLMSDVWKRSLASVPAGNASDFHGTTPENLWDFGAWKPDAVVINLGTNDGLGHRPELLDTYRSTYLDLVLKAFAAYGSGTHFILACGPMDEHYCDSVSWVLNEAEARGANVTFLDHRGFLDGSHGSSCCGHPGQDVDVAMAARAARVIAVAMGWQDDDCQDTVSWGNGYAGCAQEGFSEPDCTPAGYTCSGYVTRGWCRDGSVLSGMEWAVGDGWNNPEEHCCACGGGEHSASKSSYATLIV